MKIQYRGDSVDLEHIKEMLASPAFVILRDRILALEDVYARSLRQHEDFGKMRFTQGYLAALERVQELPKIICDEIRARQKGNV